jgi:hypothetical protein
MLTPTEKFIFSTSLFCPSYLNTSCCGSSHVSWSYESSLQDQSDVEILTDYNTLLDSFLFLFFSMIMIAITLYLPQHIAFLTNRAWFYYNGDENAKVAIQSVVESTTSSMLPEKARETVVAAAAAGGSSILNSAKEL